MITVAKKSGIIQVKPSEGYWTLPEVNYRGEIQTWNIFREMTPEMNISQLSELYTTEKLKGNPHPASVDLAFSIFRRGFELREESPDEAEDLRESFKTGLKRYPNTLSMVTYNSSGDDEITHNLGTLNEYKLKGKIVGQDGLIENLPDTNFLEIILGTKNTSEINDVFKWINSTDSYVYRINAKHSKKTERVVRFNANSDWVFLDCGWGPLGECPAFRVKVD